jgi:hypothetical protein
MKSQEIEHLETRVDNLADTTKLHAQVQDATVSKTNGITSNESSHDDEVRSGLKNEAIIESKVGFNHKSEDASVHYEVKSVASGTDDNAISDNNILERSDIETEAAKEEKEEEKTVPTLRFVQ